MGDHPALPREEVGEPLPRGNIVDRRVVAHPAGIRHALQVKFFKPVFPDELTVSKETLDVLRLEQRQGIPQ